MKSRMHVGIGAILVLLAVGYRVAFFAISVTHVPVSTDESIAMLQAKGLVEDTQALTAQAKQAPPGLRQRYPLLFMSQPYLFPIESYLYAPVVRLLPHTACGARVFGALLGLVSVALSLWIVTRLGPWQQIWPAVLLILFPSSYFLMLQTAVALPGYPSMLLFGTLAVLLAQIKREHVLTRIRLAVAAGFVAGLACSGSMLACPVFLGVAAMVCLGDGWRDMLVQTPAFLVGSALGLLPYFLTRWAIPGAYEVIANTHSVQEAVQRLWNPALAFTLPRALGIPSCGWPDNKDYVGIGAGWGDLLTTVWLAFVAGAIAICLWRFIMRWKRKHWPSVVPGDVFVFISGLTVVLFLFSQRANSTSFRYLALTVWAFPFLVAQVFVPARRFVRMAVAIVALILTTLNVTNAMMLMRAWASPRFISPEVVNLPKLEPVLQCLRSNHIDRCYATYWLAYRIDYATDEQIICSQPFNERFPGWALPYKELVDGSTRVAYVLSSGAGVRFTPSRFESELAVMEVSCRTQTCGCFSVYSDFQYAWEKKHTVVAPSLWHVTASHAANEAGTLNDGCVPTGWRSHQAQVPGMWLEIGLSESNRLSALRTVYDWNMIGDRARAVDVQALIGGQWKVIKKDVRMGLDPFEFLNNHPVYGTCQQTISFEPVLTDRLRIVISEPNPGRDWRVGEVSVFTRQGMKE